MSYQVAVRALAEFTSKQGDLDLRFTPAPSAQEGIAGHALVRARRAPGYQTEISLSAEYRHLLVRGRADGYDPVANRLEEIKTYRGDLERMPANHRHLHWAQARLYGWLLCQKLGLAQIELALVYFDIDHQRETVLTEHACADELRAAFEDQCERFLAWAAQELAHRAARDATLATLRFPHGTFRSGQRQLAEAVYRTASGGHCLLAEAPTGIGKTIGTLFPLLKAAPAQKLDKIFFLTAKTSGRGLALEALALMRDSESGLPLRVVELVARDKACEHPDKACHGESCPLAKGFYDRLPQARTAALQTGTLGKSGTTATTALLDKASLRSVALAHQVCPYYLSQDLVRWADVVVGDYNYYFDTSALLHSLMLAGQWRVSLLIDEAHNVIERARKMYSAELDQTALHFLRQSAPPELKKSLERLQRSWNAACKEQSATYQAYPAIPEKLIAALQRSVADMTDYQLAHPTLIDPALQRFYFDALHFLRLAESFGSHSLFDVTRDGARNVSSDVTREDARGSKRTTLCIRNVIPAHFTAARFAAAQSSVLFSATLSPWHFHRDMLGLPEKLVSVEVDSPFVAEQLRVRTASRISTRYRDRAESVAPIAHLIADQYTQLPGNYLAFFSSFDYLQQVADRFRTLHPDIATWEQSRRMDEAQRDAFLARFTVHSRGIGFAVLGGAFAEGIDLPGERLVGAFIATLGLPQLNPVNEEIKRSVDAVLGCGQDYTYLFPGLQKVAQAAGRVIRSPQDRGVVVLIDDRFSHAKVRRLLPKWWQIEG